MAEKLTQKKTIGVCDPIKLKFEHQDTNISWLKAFRAMKTKLRKKREAARKAKG